MIKANIEKTIDNRNSEKKNPLFLERGTGSGTIDTSWQNYEI